MVQENGEEESSIIGCNINPTNSQTSCTIRNLHNVTHGVNAQSVTQVTILNADSLSVLINKAIEELRSIKISIITMIHTFLQKFTK